MAPAQKKQKTEASEKELEDLLFGDVSEDIWDKAGHELEEQEEEEEEEEVNKYNDESQSDDDEEGGEETGQTFFFDSGPMTEAEPITNTESDDEIDYEAEEEMEEEQGSSEENSSEESDSSDEDEQEHNFKLKSAWEDEDDARLKISLVASSITKKLRNDVDEDVISGVEYSRRLRNQFNKIYPKPEWARLPSEIKADNRKRKAADSDDESDNENEYEDEDQLDEEDRLDLLKSTMGILERRGDHKLLPAGHLDIMRLTDANVSSKSKKKITSIAFHPNAQVLMTAGLDKTLRLFQIDGKINPKIQSVYFKDMPIYHAEFHPSGNEIILTGRRKYFYIYDIQSGVIDKCPGIWGKDEKSLESFSISPCGRYIGFLGTSGKIIIVSYLTKQWIGDLKVNKVVESIDWSSDGKYLFAFNNDGEVYQFNVATKECVKRWVDDGCIGASEIRVSPNEKYYATGSSSGVVNVYDRSVLQPDNTRPQPIKAIGNLTTRISDIAFNHDSQLMVISSRTKKDQLKLVHLPSCTVYSNWPTQRTPLGHVCALAFSPNSDYLAVANDRGHVRLYTLKHYALK